MLSAVTGVRWASRQRLRRLATTAEIRDLPQAGLCGISNSESGAESSSSPSSSAVHCQYHCTILSYYCTYQKDKRAKPGTFTQSDALTKIGEQRAKNASLISVVLQRVLVLQTDGQADERAFFFPLPTARLKGGD